MYEVICEPCSYLHKECYGNGLWKRILTEEITSIHSGEYSPHSRLIVACGTRQSGAARIQRRGYPDGRFGNDLPMTHLPMTRGMNLQLRSVDLLESSFVRTEYFDNLILATQVRPRVYVKVISGPE